MVQLTRSESSGMGGQSRTTSLGRYRCVFPLVLGFQIMILTFKGDCRPRLWLFRNDHFCLFTTMLTALLLPKPASAVALNSMGGISFACIDFAVAQPWLEARGIGWMFTATAGIIGGWFGVIEALRRWGAI